ncbi:unnamed protein product [Allacma fusca]|uniref:acid phosphatase n=1 Tax=Allacma fusca TaxID=39272 RepID=A0A8J2LKF5_9HEXA|nr:unnamed protein product [Allacma fusca]
MKPSLATKAFICYLISQLCVFSVKGSGSSLKSVQIVFRHGERTPRISYESSGESKLTNKGKKEILELGQYVQKRYRNFLKSDVDRRSVNFISSDMDRTLESASVFAYGLFQNLNEKSSWNDEGLQYEPTPIQSIPEHIDRYLQSTEPCPRYTEQLFPASTTECMEDIARENPEMINEFTKLTGNNVLLDPTTSGAAKADVIAVIGDQIRYNISNNLPLSDVGHKLSRFPIIFDISTKCQVYLFESVELQKLYSGPLLKSILDNFQAEKPKKLVAFSAHDRTLFGQLMILGLVPPEIPRTGSAMIYELYASDRRPSQRFLKIYYRNGKGLELKEIKVPGCGERCYLEHFLKIMQNVIPVNFVKECLLLDN